MFSIITPLDPNRLEQFKKTKRAYDRMPQEKEFIIPTRHEFEVARYLDDHKLIGTLQLFPTLLRRGSTSQRLSTLESERPSMRTLSLQVPKSFP